MKRIILSFGVIVFLLAACTSFSQAGPNIKIENAWVRPAVMESMNGMSGTPQTQPDKGMQDMGMPTAQAMPEMSDSGPSSAAYFVIVNDGNQPDSLIGVSTDAAKEADLHQTRIDSNDVAQMIPIQRVDVPAHGRIEFKPAGYHVMLMGLARDLKTGETLKLILQFEKSGPISVDAMVRQGQ